MRATASVLNRKAMRWFLLAAGCAIAWFGLNLLASDWAVGPVPLRLLGILAWNVVLVYGLWRALARTELSRGARGVAWLAVTLVITIWIAAAWILAVNGVFHRTLFGKVPTLPLAIVLPLLIGIPVLTRSQAVAKLLDATPAHWLIGLQVYRVLGAFFFVYWIQGSMPGAFALPAGIGDVATGLLALPAAVWVASGTPTGRSIGTRWNVFGLIDFTVAVTLGMLTSVGPAHLLALDHPNTQIETFPAAITPAFIVPCSTLLHVLSLRQLGRLRSAATIVKQERIPAMT